MVCTWSQAEVGAVGAMLREGPVQVFFCCWDPLRPPSLPVLLLLHYSLGDAAAQQAEQKENAHAQANHSQDVVLGG